MKLAISKTVIDRLSRAREPSNGKLHGFVAKDILTVLELELDLNNADHHAILNNSYLKCCGLFQLGDCNIDKLVQNNSFDIEQFVVISRGLDDSNLSVGLYDNGNVKSTSYDILEDTNSQFVYLNLKGEFGITYEADTDDIKHKFEDLQNTVSLVFRIIKGNIFLLGPKSISSSDINKDATIGEVYNSYSDQQEEGSKKKQKVISKPKILEAVVLKQICKCENDHFEKKHAPVCNVNKYQKKVVHTTVSVDSLVMIDIGTRINELYPVLKEAFSQYIHFYEQKMLARFKQNKDLHLKVFHFYPKQCGHFITLLYPNSEGDKELRNDRQTLHKILLIKEIVPIFRKSNQYHLETNNKPNQPLINPHEGLKPTDNGGQVALVRGIYQYYHYCQDNADDNGWGCAYRSLQTLASWFKLQGYIDMDVPSFRDIQKCLVDIQDKPANFLGSKQWIGSTEVSFVLSTLLGVESKILFVNSGEEMATKGPELVEHFTTHGSPIMIGGGVLAHTILGVDYNRETGDMRYLILDPHYTGSEDLHTIQAKGWCGWKKGNFWNKTSFYNMCLPLVPKDI